MCVRVCVCVCVCVGVFVCVCVSFCLCLNFNVLNSLVSMRFNLLGQLAASPLEFSMGSSWRGKSQTPPKISFFGLFFLGGWRDPPSKQ